MRVLLIQASHQGAADRAVKIYRTEMPMLGLLYVAAGLPADVELDFVDEANQQITEFESYDVVGISGMTMHANRMYNLADRYRELGAHVALGGVHVTFRVDEALQHADTVFIGESDLTWPQFIEDFKRGRARKTYLPDRVVSLKGLPRLDLSLVDGPAYRSRESTINGISATRGCPNTCNFCCVRLMFDDVVRQRPAHEVAAEIAAMEDGFVMFQDDNIVGNQRYAAQLFAALKPLGREWGAQGSINVTNNDKLLKGMADSGCRSLFVGFESISEETLQILSKGKVNKARKFRDQIKKLHDHGIMIVGSFIVGIDGEPPSVFDDIYKLVDETGIEFPVINCLTPFPGTPLYDSLKKADRIIDHNWDHYDLQHVVIKPWDQEPEQLQFKYNTLNHYLARLQRDSVFAHTASI